MARLSSMIAVLKPFSSRFALSALRSVPPSREALKGSNIMERHQGALHPKQLDDQAPTRAIEHDTFHNDTHSIRTKNNVSASKTGMAEPFVHLITSILVTHTVARMTIYPPFRALPTSSKA